MSMTGRFAYSWASDDRPARLDAALTAPEIDLDRVQALAKAVLGDTDFDWPREGALSLKIDRASLGGVDAKRADVNVRIDANGFGIERLTIADFGGAALAVKGRIDNHTQSPRGEVTLDLDARSLDGVTTLIEKFAPAAADQLRRCGRAICPAEIARPAVGRSGHAERGRGDERAGQIQGRRQRRRLPHRAARRCRRRRRGFRGRQSRAPGRGQGELQRASRGR